MQEAETSHSLAAAKCRLVHAATLNSESRIVGSCCRGGGQPVRRTAASAGFCMSHRHVVDFRDMARAAGMLMRGRGSDGVIGLVNSPAMATHRRISRVFPPPATHHTGAHWRTRCIGSAASRERLGPAAMCLSGADGSWKCGHLITSTHMSWIKQKRGGPSTANTGPRRGSSAAHASIGDQHHHALRYAARPAKDPEDWRFWNGAGTAIAHSTRSAPGHCAGCCC